MKLTAKVWVFEQIEIVTVGFPFCLFKYLSGLILIQHDYQTIGYVLLVLGIVDLLINAINWGWLLFFRKRFFGTCFINIIAYLLSKNRNSKRADSWSNVGSSLDVLISFIIVAGMIGLGGLKFLTQTQLDLWNVSVILNVLGAGFGRIAESIFHLNNL